MKTFTSLILLVLFFATSGYSQPDTTHRVRQADSLTTFFVGSTGPFDNWDLSDSANHFGTMSQSGHRYYNIEDSLGLNAEDRGFWDYPSNHPAPKDTVLGGKRAPFLDVLILEPLQLFTAFDNAQYLRYEFERHDQKSNDSEYLGFLNRSGLTGRNQKTTGATFPAFLKGSGRDADTGYNAVVLDTSIDAAGVFADTIWNSAIWVAVGPSPYSPAYYDRKNSRKMMVRIRVKINQTVDTSAAPILFILTRMEKDLINNTTIVTTVTNLDTVKVDSHFKHVNANFDTVEIPFMRNDTTNCMFFSYYWPKHVNAIFDYMELMTAHINPTDTDLGSIGYPKVDSGEASAYSGEDFLDSIPVALINLLDTIKKNYQDHVTYLRIGDEFPIAEGLPFKRLVKLVRDSTGGQIEVCPFTVDSGIGWFGTSLPDAHVFNFEGARKGWVDTSRYADPKMLFFDPYVIETLTPLPKRITSSLADTTTLKNWEDQFLPSYNTNSNTVIHTHYTRDAYLKQIQFKEFAIYLNANRHLRRWTERQNNGSHFGIDWQAGGAVSAVEDSSHLILSFTGLRPPNGPEMKLTGHLTASCGGLGLILYNLRNPEPNDGYEDGGIMNFTGSHDSMYYTTYVIHNPNTTHDSVPGRVWMGFHERYDTVRKLIPILIKYGTTLLKDACIGDWLAAELPNTPDSNILPFFYKSIVALDDSLRSDIFKKDSVNGNPDTTNRTFVHISMWLDTNSAAKANHSDTLLYITNMRTDDSYDTTEVPSTIDRRLITMRLKRPHVILDVMDTNGGQLDNGKIWTPYVGAADPEDSLKLYLLPGDGILIRLMDTVQGNMHQMRYSVNFPKNTNNFVDHGRLKFDRPVPGVRNLQNDWSVPSTHLPYIVGIPDTSHAVIWQDSLLFQKFHSTRTEKWRQHHWLVAFPTSPQIIISNKDSLLTSTLARPDLTSTDSIAHQIVIKTDLEGQSSSGKIKFRDPFLVDSATRNNVYDTLAKGSPFLPQVLSVGRMPGADSEHYGGIFLKENFTHNITLPIYSVNAYNILNSGTFQGQDTGAASTGDWVFLHWVSNDLVDPSDIAPWQENPLNFDGTDYPLFNIGKSSEVVFVKDSAQYIARYKAHMAAFNNISDPGFAMNNQRKLYYLYTDAALKRWYQIIYASAGRIYTALGFRTGTGDADIHWNNEQLLSEWDDQRAEFPAFGLHIDTTGISDTTIHFVYQTTDADSTSEIKIGNIINGIPYIYADLDQDPSGGTDIGTGEATPVIGSVEAVYGPLDVTAWATPFGIAVKAIGRLEATDGSSVRTDGMTGGPEFFFGDSTAKHPTIWVDTCFVCGLDSSVHLVTLAWQQDTLIHNLHGIRLKPNGDSTFTDIFAVQFDVRYGKRDSAAPYIYFRKHSGVSLSPTDVSYMLNYLGWDNRNPCISGARYATDSSVIRLTYETKAYNIVRVEGISVDHLRTGNLWKTTKFFQTTDTTTDYFSKPSIEVSRYHDYHGAKLPVSNYYSLAYERYDGTSTQQWGMDSAAQRVAPNTFSSSRLPQLAVVKESIDSDTYRMGLSLSGSPAGLNSGYTGLYKLGGVDTLWGYHAITETDSANTIFVAHCIGEPAIDNGQAKQELELIERSEDEMIDGNHSADYFMQTENFTLPKSGTFSYFLWIKNSGDALYKSKFDTIKYVLDFFDTTGTYVCRLDSVVICDSVPHISDTVHSVNIDRDNSAFGYARFRRITSALSTSGSQWEPVITQKRLSSITSYKRNSIYSLEPNDILFTAEPNPSRGDVTLTFGIPADGGVTIEAYNQLGVKVSEITKVREFHAGGHQVIWHPSSLPSGMYYMKLQYGNSEKVIRVMYIQ